MVGILLKELGEEADGLHRFPQTHIVGEAGTKAVAVKEINPRTALFLVGAQLSFQTSRLHKLAHAVELRKTGKEIFGFLWQGDSYAVSA